MTRSKRWDDDWRKSLLMTWLCTPPAHREPRTKGALAAMFDVTLRTINDWINEDSFRLEWTKRACKVVGDEDRTKEVLDTLYAAATDTGNRNHVQAAKLYLEATNAIKPQAVKVEVTRPSDLSDAELDALLAKGAAELREERSDAPD